MWIECLYKNYVSWSLQDDPPIPQQKVSQFANLFVLEQHLILTLPPINSGVKYTLKKILKLKTGSCLRFEVILYSGKYCKCSPNGCALC